MAKRFVLVRESGDRAIYFKALMLGLFWECTNDVAAAAMFHKRATASSVLVKSHKNREGWRVVTIDV